MTQLTINNSFFRFEQDFTEPNIRCIPMIVRFKLDACGIKLSLSQWSKMNDEQRRYLADAPCDEAEDVIRYRKDLTRLIVRLTGSDPTFIPVPVSPAWGSRDDVPQSIMEQLAGSGESITLEQWRNLTTLQRFALVKLSRPGHENRNFSRAVEEFGLISVR
ncbi:MAG TPA: nitrate reductase associated protein [Chryseosolibacter sp.]|nr:nitrate reductase associated protein [Chryseosolibacter sp.]